MPYSSIGELPKAVRARFKGKPKKLRQFMHVFNSEYITNHDESRAFASAWATVQKAAEIKPMDDKLNFFLPIIKIDKENRTISGYASTSCLDSDGEIVSQEAIKAALPEYMKWANIREMHQPSAVGVAKEANLDARGLYLTAKIADDRAWGLIKDGVYKGFSIGGRKLAKVGNTITKLAMIEISIVDRPANPECSFAVNKAASPDAPAYLLPKNADNLDEDESPEQEPDNDYDDPLEVSMAIEDNTPAVDSRTKKIKKREFSSKQRKSLAGKGDALPDGSFPIANEGDLKNAVRAIGRSKNPNAARAHIKSRAKTLGLSSLIPDDWLSAKKLAKRQKESASTSLSPTHGVDGGAEAVLGKVECSHELDLRSGCVSLDGHDKVSLPIALRERDIAGVKELSLQKSSRKDKVMENNGGSALENSKLNKLIADTLAKVGVRAADPTLLLLKAAEDDMKSSKDKRKDAEDEVEKLFNLHKAEFEKQQGLIKAGKLKDSSGFDHGAAMKSIKGVYDNLREIKSLTKNAKQNLTKAAGRITGAGTVEDSLSGVYDVPSGIRTISPGEMDNLPASKMAKNAGETETVSKVEMDALLRAAKAEAEANLLKAMPAAPAHGQRPVAFDMTKFGGAQGVTNDNPLLKDINPSDLGSQDQSTRENAVAKLIGNRILIGGGQTIFDPTFKGTVGGGTGVGTAGTA